MPSLEVETNLTEFTNRLETLIGETVDDVVPNLAERAFADYRPGWPVDTGLSKRGLSYRLQKLGRRWVMTFTNTWGYAYWVEQRWYPIVEHLRLDRIVAAVNRDTRLARRLNRR